MGISRKSRIVLLALVGGATLAVAFLAVQHHSRSLTVLTTILGFGTGLVCTNLWPDWPRPLRKWGLAILFLALVLDVRQSWVRRETFWAICYAAVVLLAIVLFIRKLRVQSQFQGAEEWPLTKGGFSGNYEDGGDRVIYYGYKVGDGYYSGFVAAGSTLKMGLKPQLDALEGKPAFVRYKPDQPEISTLFESDQLESTL